MTLVVSLLYSCAPPFWKATTKYTREYVSFFQVFLSERERFEAVLSEAVERYNDLAQDVNWFLNERSVPGGRRETTWNILEVQLVGIRTEVVLLLQIQRETPRCVCSTDDLYTLLMEADEAIDEAIECAIAPTEQEIFAT